MTFEKDKDLRCIQIYDIVRSLGSRSKALSFFHARENTKRQYDGSGMFRFLGFFVTV